jgi:hypothetical protein
MRWKELTIFLFFLINFQSFSQTPFFKTISGKYEGRNVKISALANEELLVLATDSQRLMKFNACGEMVWNLKLTLASELGKSSLFDLLVSKNQKIYLMCAHKLGEKVYPMICQFNTDGQLLFAKIYKDPFYTHFPYSLSERPDGNLVLFEASQYQDLTYNQVLSISPEGELIQSIFYSEGGIWGEALATSDTGFVFRSGNRTQFGAKTGYAKKCFIQSQNRYFYYRPVEVKDGFIFSGTNQANQIFFYKTDKEGETLDSNLIQTGFNGRPLKIANSGNDSLWQTLFSGGNEWAGKMIWAEWDHHLKRRSSIAFSLGEGEMLPLDFSPAENGRAWIAGLYRKNTGSPFQLFIGRISKNQTRTCVQELGWTTEKGSLVHNFYPSETSPYYGSVENFQNPNPVEVKTNLLMNLECGSPAPIPQVDLGKDTAICSDQNLVLKNKIESPFNRRLWSTGDSSGSIQTKQPGKYWLRLWQSCANIAYSDSVEVTLSGFPPFELISEKEICEGEKRLLHGPVEADSVIWDNGNRQRERWVDASGTYSLTAFSKGCPFPKSHDLTECEKLELPNTVTINGDGKNEAFSPKVQSGLAYFDLKIFDRWGKEVFSGKGADFPMWKPQDTPQGVYFYHMDVLTISGKKWKFKDWVLVSR